MKSSLGFLSAFLLAASTSMVRADLVLHTFDTASGTNGWYWEDWSAPGGIEFDPADDAAFDPASGSMQLIANFPAGEQYQQAVFSIPVTGAPNLSPYAKVALDIKLDADSIPRTGVEDSGHFEIILRLGSSWTWTSISFDALTGNEWQRIEANIPTLTPPDDTLNALTLKIGDGNFAGPVKVHVDNITLVSRPEPITVLNAFNDESEITPWYWENWSVLGTVEFDPSNDSQGDSSSGSLKLTSSLENIAGYQQSVYSTTLNPPIDGVTYAKIEMDVKVDASASTRRTGQADYGTFEVILRNGPEWTWNSITNVVLTNDTDWVHIEAFLIPPSDDVHHLTLKLGQNGFGGPVVLNVDNIVLIENTNKVVAPPSLSIARATPGLNLIASQLQSQYQRQSIRTVNGQFSWVGRGQPVSYSMDIASFPDPATYPGFQAHVFLLPTDPAPDNSDVDWNQPHIIFVDLAGQENGSVIGTFRYKTNLPNGNSMIFNANPANGAVGTLGSVTNSSGGAGRWTIRFNSDTQATLTAPNGNTAEVTLPADAAALFAGPLYAYFGAQPNQLANIGQALVVSRIEITGTEIPLTETFAGGELNPEVWATAALDARGIIPVTAETPWVVKWTTPAAGFALQGAANLSQPAWSDVTATAVPVASFLQTTLNQTNLPSANMSFFRLIRR